mmetsp:Transcript_46907/g.142097  ORF Transcript_46907/g.142097 Transcript_46907/m.142097 type:complete len:203 (-) Transcript_46907:199-807(-)|eukprot:CAMPEP_0113551080 /NCGR_PEP_ID=MMETSP0015_2-20120614/14330_1 /TAXON_ID=2838 /ORGANISM="Odontella" /LENGTH=202 /DNA_ID=CAMNT_0000451941 /DNA_START=135 /DNA_END=743 /DNA_ORIENTATION=+ /assembly_acc=CAM_ASM_000160
MTDQNPTISDTLALGAGCYWGTEKYVKKDFQKKFPGSIKSARVGFMSPDPNAMKDPTYRQVCSGQTGHVEVLYVELFHPEKHFEELVKFFFQFHDPTTLNRQGNDAGTQYASYILVSDDEQERIAKEVVQELQGFLDTGKIAHGEKKSKFFKGPAYNEGKVNTAVAKTTEFYEAHEEHQQYLEKNPNGYCNHRIRIKEWPSK